MEQAKQNPTACTLMTNSIRFEADGSSLNVFQYFGIDLLKAIKNDSCLIERPLNFIIQKGLLYLQGSMFRREAFIRAGLFNEKVTITEDLEAIARMCLQGPLSICTRPLAHIVRRKEAINNLSSAWYFNNMYCRDAFGAIYEGLLSQNNLTDSERKVVNKVLSANKKSVGNLYLRNGEILKARRCYGEALLLDPSPKSLCKLLISYLPRRVALACNKSDLPPIPWTPG
jgi:tetratricopeptide (TPR) repeat protein